MTPPSPYDGDTSSTSLGRNMGPRVACSRPLPVAPLWPYIRYVTGPDPLLVFDRAMLRRRRERAARDWDKRAFLKREIASRLVERLGDVRRSFPNALDLGSHGDEIGAALGPDH